MDHSINLLEDEPESLERETTASQGTLHVAASSLPPNPTIESGGREHYSPLCARALGDALSGRADTRVHVMQCRVYHRCDIFSQSNRPR